ncbi:hypothetical protein E2C06_05790 [Dankookia rubra]|uniref:Uncharacterized protein n=1 Tax=Dankookia rubra TaxID=1442381 RepID=A0A4R5QJU9_9PROT|nr:hypothetical protein [Dankookia rubra]TDH63353.1 hypothetical protein E2C06_05790 [Dankookia rubra]
MPLFTVEVASRPVLVFSETSRDSAEEILASLIGPDLQEFESEGVPVWDGEAPLAVRDADPVETTRWEQGLAEAQEDSAGEEDGPGDGDDFAVFLIELDEEGEEADGEEA